MGGGGSVDTSKQDAILEKQQAMAEAKEKQLALELAHRRNSMRLSSGGYTATLFSQVEGQAESTRKKTTLGG